jgi:GDP-L-fucose synthase
VPEWKNRKVIICGLTAAGKNAYQASLVPCNLYGRHDKFDPVNSHMLPAIIYKLHKAKKEGTAEVEIWGDGLARREFMYAEDLAGLIFYCIEHFQKLPDLMNVGLGHDYSVNEYYRIAGEVVGYKGRFVNDLSKPVGMKQKLVSIDRMKSFGWTEQTSLESGIAKTYKYFLNLN